MNTKVIERQYEKLRPEERVALIMAATARGDDYDRERLLSSTPSVGVQRADTFPVSQALLEVTLQENGEQLSLAARFWQAQWAADDMRGDPKNGARVARLARVYGYLVVTYAAGWELFTAARLLTPAAATSFVATLPWREMLADSRRFAAAIAATAAEVEEYFRASAEPCREPGAVLTAESHAASLEKVYAARLAFWSPG